MDITPEIGEIVRARGQQSVANRRSTSSLPRTNLHLPDRTLATHTSVSDDDLGDELTLGWEVEPGREILPETRLPDVTPTGYSWDLDLDFGRHRTKIGTRWTVPPAARFELLHLLLEENRRRAGYTP